MILDADSPAPPARRGPLRALRLVLAVLAVLAAIPVAVIGLLQLPETVRWAAQQALDRTRPIRGTRIVVGRARGGVLSGIELYDVTLASGSFVHAHVDTVSADYRLGELLARPLRIRAVRARGLSFVTTPALDSLRAWFAPSGGGGSGFRIGVDRIEVERGALWVARGDLAAAQSERTAWRIRDLALRLSALTAGAGEAAMTFDSLRAALLAPGGAPLGALAARARFDEGRFDDVHVTVDGAASHLAAEGAIAVGAERRDRSGSEIELRLAPLAGADLMRLFPRLPRAPDVSLDARLASASDSVAFDLAARGSDGAQLHASGHLDRAPANAAALELHARLSGLDPSAWSAARSKDLRISGSADGRLGGADLAHLSGPLALAAQAVRSGDARRARANLSATFRDGQAAVRADGSLDGWTARAAGTVRPLGKVAGCDLDLAADIPPIDPWRPSGPPRARALIAGRLVGTLRAERVEGASLTAHTQLDFDPDSPARSMFGPGRIALSLDHGAVLWNAAVQIEHGSLSAAGNFVSGREPRYAIRSGAAHALPIGELLGDSTASRLDADFTLEGRGLDPATARIDAQLAPAALEIRHQSVRLDSLRLTLAANRLSARWRGAMDGAAIAGRAGAAPALPPYREADWHAEFSGVDAARISSDSSWASTLAGSIDATIRAPDLAPLFAPTRMSESEARAASGTLRVRFAPSTWRREQLSQLTIDASLEGGAVNSAGRLEGSFGRIHWTATARPFGPRPAAHLTSLTLGDVDLARLIAPSLPHTRLSGEVSAEGSGAALDTMTARSGVNLDGSSVGATRFSRLRLSGGLARGVLDARLEADRGRDSLLARIAGRLAHVRQGLALSGQLRGAARFGGATFDTVLCDFALAGDELELPRLHLAGNVADLFAHGRIALSRAAPADSTEFALAAALRDLRPLGERLHIQPCQAGAGFLTVTARGALDDRDIAATLRATRIRLGSSRADSLDLTARAFVHGSAIDSATVHLFASGLVPQGLQERDLDAHARWAAGELALEARSMVIDGGRQALALRLRPGTPVTDLWLDRLEFETRGTNFTLAQPARIGLGHEISVDHLELTQDGRRCIHVNGAVRDDASASLVAALDSVDVAVPLALMGVPGLRGRASGSLTVTGPRREPAISGWLRSSIGTSGGRPARLEDTLSWRSGTLHSRLHFDQTAQQRVALDVTVPLALNLEPQPGERMLTLREDVLEAALESKRFDVAWFQPLISPRVVRKLSGSIDGSVRISGSPQLPRFDGAFALTHARAQVPPLGTTFEARPVTLAFRSRTIELQPATVTAGSGRAELSGTATFDGPGRRTLDAHATFGKFQVMNTALAHVEVNGTLAVSGALERPALSGSLELANSTLYLEGGQTDRRLEQVELTEDDWRQLDARFSESDAEPRRPFSSLADSASVDVTVKMGRNVWVRRRSDPIVALELSGKVRATREPGAPPELAGQLDVETGRSYLSFLNRRFDMTRAQVELPGPIPQAHAELEAQYLPGASSNGSSSAGPDVTAVVTLGAEGARVDLHSTPFMDHASLVNYLATGQTQGEMSSGTAYGLAVGTVLGSVGGSAGRSLGLDVVQVTQDAYGGQTLAAGSHVKPELYLGFRQPVVQGQQNSSRGENSTYTTEFEVEVEAGRQMLLNVQGGGSQYRFLLRPRLGK